MGMSIHAALSMVIKPLMISVLYASVQLWFIVGMMSVNYQA